MEIHHNLTLEIHAQELLSNRPLQSIHRLTYCRRGRKFMFILQINI